MIIFIQGLVSFSGAGHTNPPPAQPAQLQMYGCGQKAANWTFAGGGSVRHLVAYAPRGVMTLRNDAIVFGSFIGDKVKKENDGDVTYDPSVASIMPPGWSGGGGGAAKMIKRTWTEF